MKNVNSLYHLKALGFDIRYNANIFKTFNDHFIRKLDKIILWELFNHSRVLIIGNRDVFKINTYGEDYYIRSLIDILTDLKCDVKFVKFNRRDNNKKEIIKLVKNEGFRHVLLHNVSLLDFYTLRKHNPSLLLVLIIYFTWNRSMPFHRNLLNNIGISIESRLADFLIVTSENIARELKFLGVKNKIITLPPHYECKYCSLRKNIMKYEKLLRELPRIVKATYIGSLNRKRFPLAKIIKLMRRDNRLFNLTIYTADNIGGHNYTINYGNIKVRIVKKILSEEEKCSILSDSHVFIAPCPRTTMDPPISVLEALYHGNIIITL